MRDILERQFQCTIRDWGVCLDDDTQVWSAVQRGRLIVAHSLALLISALQERVMRPVELRRAA